MSAGGRTSPVDGTPTGLAVDPSKGAGVDVRACAVLASSLLAWPGDHTSAAQRPELRGAVLRRGILFFPPQAGELRRSLPAPGIGKIIYLSFPCFLLYT